MRSERSRPPSIPARISAVGLIMVGTVVMVVAVFADPLGIGGGEGFGWMQLIAAIAGLVLVLFGLAWLLRAALGSEPDEPLERVE